MLHRKKSDDKDNVIFRQQQVSAAWRIFVLRYFLLLLHSVNSPQKAAWYR